jgi:hypothetical protein
VVLAAVAGCGGGGGRAFVAPFGPQVLTGMSTIEVTPLALRRNGRDVIIDVRLRNIGDSVDATRPGVRGHLVLAGQRVPIPATGECRDRTGFPLDVGLAPGDTMEGCLAFVVPAHAKATAFQFGDILHEGIPEWPLDRIPTGGPARTTDQPAATPLAVGSPATLRGKDYSVDLAGGQTTEADQRLEVTVLTKVDHAPPISTPPDDGTRLVAVRVQIRDTGTSPYFPYLENDVVLWDSTGHAHETGDVSATALGSWPDGTVAPGATITGYLTFEVPESVRLTRFEWTLRQGGKDAAGYWELF